MKILFACTSPRARGTEQHIAALAPALTGLGVECAAFTDPDGFLGRRFRAEGLPIHPGRIRNAVHVSGIRKLRRVIRQYHPDWLVVAAGHEYWPALAAGRRSRTPVALFRHIDKPMKPLSRRLLPRLAKRFIVVSDTVRENLARQGVPESLIHVLYNPVDTDRFRPDPAQGIRVRETLGIAPESTVVGFVGEMQADKGIVELEKAVDALSSTGRELEVLWVGDGPLFSGFRRSVQHAGRHHFVGRVEDVAAHCNAMDVVVMPSTRREAFGRVAVEAQACGVPVIGSRLGGIPESIRDGETGWLIPPRDVDALVQALTRFCGLSPAQRNEMGSAGRRFVRENFSATSVAESFLRLLAP